MWTKSHCAGLVWRTFLLQTFRTHIENLLFLSFLAERKQTKVELNENSSLLKTNLKFMVLTEYIGQFSFLSVFTASHGRLVVKILCN